MQPIFLWNLEKSNSLVASVKTKKFKLEDVDISNVLKYEILESGFMK